MAAAAPALYEPMLERDVPEIRRAVAAFAAEHSADELFIHVARFAVLAYAPSEHGKHAVIAALCAHELREDLGSHWIDLIIECAIYAALSRQPWSEPPILDPPPVAEDQPRDIEELREAVRTRDRLRGERWLAARIDDPFPDLFLVAAEDLDDFGHKLIMAVTARSLAELLGEKGRFAALRVATWEMTAYGGAPPTRRRSNEDLDSLIARCVEEHGSLESVHAVFLYEAELQSGGQAILPVPTERIVYPPPIYALGRDYAQYLEACAVGKRLKRRFPDAPIDAFIAAAHENLETAASFEEWSFA